MRFDGGSGFGADSNASDPGPTDGFTDKDFVFQFLAERSVAEIAAEGLDSTCEVLARIDLLDETAATTPIQQVTLLLQALVTMASTALEIEVHKASPEWDNNDNDSGMT